MMVNVENPKAKRKSVDFEINLIPAIDLLSVCICFLLLTAVWINLGTLKLEQGVGETNSSSGQNPPSLWIEVQPSGDVILSTRDLQSGVKGFERALIARARDGQVDRERLNRFLVQAKETTQVDTAVVRPQQKVNYGEVIAVIDGLKTTHFKDVGLAPES